MELSDSFSADDNQKHFFYTTKKDVKMKIKEIPKENNRFSKVVDIKIVDIVEWLVVGKWTREISWEKQSKMADGSVYRLVEIMCMKEKKQWCKNNIS